MARKKASTHRSKVGGRDGGQDLKVVPRRRPKADRTTCEEAERSEAIAEPVSRLHEFLTVRVSMTDREIEVSVAGNEGAGDASSGNAVSSREIIAEQEPRKRRSQTSRTIEAPAPLAPPRVLGKRLADVAPETAQWLWPGRIPARKVCLLQGRPNLGKSFITVDLAARLSTGRPMPFCDNTQRAPVNALIMNSEDAIADTIRPRVDAAGGDPERITVFSPEECVGVLSNLRDLEATILAEKIMFVAADPFSVLLGSDVNAQNEQGVRSVLTPLADVATRTGATFLLVRHETKSRDPDPLNLGSGSVGIGAAARAALRVMKRPGKQEECLLDAFKGNLSARARQVAYKLVAAGDVARVEWVEEVEPELAEE